MAARIRLTRIGRRGSPFFRIVVMDRREKRTGRVIENLGYYDPKQNPPLIKLDKEKLEKWIKNGADVSDPVKKIL